LIFFSDTAVRYRITSHHIPGTTSWFLKALSVLTKLRE
jgi:hypothetical protein